MNQFFDIEEDNTIDIYYTLGVKLKTSRYINISRSHRDYLRYVYSLLWGHVKTYRDDSEFGRHMYYKMFVEYPEDLPKPTKGKQRKNTWGTFLQGIEHNFLYAGTQDFTVKQLEHVIHIVNIAVEYFRVGYPDFDHPVELNPVQLVKA